MNNDNQSPKKSKKPNMRAANRKAYYTAQFHRTTANKARRAKKRERIANSPATAERAAKREAKRLARYAANRNRRNLKAVLNSDSAHLAAALNEAAQ